MLTVKGKLKCKKFGPLLSAHSFRKHGFFFENLIFPSFP